MSTRPELDVATLTWSARRMVVRLDIATKNPLNNSQGRTRAGMLWRARMRKGIRHQTREQCAFQWRGGDPWYVTILVGDERVARPVPRIGVTIVRISPLPLDHWDGLRAALKPVVDGVADFLGVKDNDKRVTWNYNQRKGRVREHAVEITFEREPQ